MVGNGHLGQQPRNWRGFEDDAAAPDLKRCEWPVCDDEGAYRAPLSRTQLRAFRWFCMDHVRLYNASWNYFTGLDPREIEDIRKRDTVWHRPTWPMGAGAGHQKRDRAFGMHDSHGVFGADDCGANAPLDTPRDRALALLGLDRMATAADIKARYKTLVKRHHPDANGGSKHSEEIFKTINAAYCYLLNCVSG